MPESANISNPRSHSIAAFCRATEEYLRNGKELPKQVESLLLFLRLMFPADLLKEAQQGKKTTDEMRTLLELAERVIPVWVCNVGQNLFKMYPFPLHEIPSSINTLDDVKSFAQWKIRLRGFTFGAMTATALRDYEAGQKEQDKQLLEQLKDCVTSTLEQPHRYASAWFDGYAKGLNTQFVDEEGRPARFTDNFPIYNELFTNWKHVSTLKSVTQLYEWLRTQQPLCFRKGETPQKERDARNDDILRMQKFCQRIRLRFRSAGRPRRNTK